MAEAAARASSFDIHGGGIDLVFPHHENEAAQTLAGARRAARAAVDAQRDARSSAEREDGQVGRATSAASRDVLDEVGRDALLMYFVGGHYRQPLAFSRRARSRRRGARRAARSARPAAGSCRGDVAGGPGAAARRVLRRARRRLQHRRAALAALFDWIREANRRDGPSATPHLREMLGVLGLENLLDAAARAPPEELVELAERRDARPRATRDFAEADRLRDELRARGLGGPRRPGRARSSSRRELGDRLRPQRRARGRCARPRRGARGSRGRPRGAARARRGCADGGACAVVDRRGDRARAAAPTRHQGVCAEVEPYPYADAAELLAAPEPLLVALDEVTDPQNLGAVCRTAESAGATGVVIPERRSAEVTPAVCKASAGAVEHLPSRGAQPRRLPRPTPRRPGCWATARRPARARRTTRRDYRGGRRRSCSARRASGLRPRVAAACDDLVALPCAGASSRST